MTVHYGCTVIGAGRHLHCELAASGCPLQDPDNVQPALLSLPDGSTGHAQGKCQEALCHVHEGGRELPLLLSIVKIWPSKDLLGCCSVQVSADHVCMLSRTYRSLSSSRQRRDAVDLHVWAAHLPDEGSDLALAVRLQPLRNVAAHDAILQLHIGSQGLACEERQK